MTHAGEGTLADLDSLIGTAFPDVTLKATDGAQVNLSKLAGLCVVYAYPRTSPPDGLAVPGWSEIPGAKGCTPQSCGFRDHHAELLDAGVGHLFGLSTQSSEYQSEVVTRLHLPFALLSDADLQLQRALSLPTFTVAEMTLLHRVTMIIRDGIIAHIFHTIRHPAENAVTVLNHIKASENNLKDSARTI